MFDERFCLPYPDFLIVANGEFPSVALFREILKIPRALVAVDGGLHFYSQISCYPDLITGDFDSAPRELLDRYRHIPQVTTPDQEKTDLEKALELVFAYSPSSVTVCGALGKRVDHTMANLNLLARYPDQLVYETDWETCFALPHYIHINTEEGQRISLMPIGSVKCVNSRGLKWELREDDMDSHAFGLSNQSMGKSIEIEKKDGHLILCLHRK